MESQNENLKWHRVADIDELPEGRVKTVAAGTHTMALTHIDGEFTAMEN
jgi:nitrite reductase/ring-hydroxylating ferredoxin subunit